MQMNLANQFFGALALITAVYSSASAIASDVDITDATARMSGDSWTFSVTLMHDDSGWDHYADLWQIYSPDGKLLGERVLLHPHVQEQPFTRSLSGVEIPDDVSEVFIRAHDSVHGQSPQNYRIVLPR
jgi:hypothetical protein